jgi:hypothetical protein
VIKGQLGGATRLTNEDKATLRASAGVHLATQRPFDVGAGWTMDRTESAMAHGGYVDAAWLFDRTDVSRASVGLRAELRSGDERVAEGKVRIEYGVTAFGTFFEVGRAWASESTNAWVAGFGVVFRLPAIFTP